MELDTYTPLKKGVVKKLLVTGYYSISESVYVRGVWLVYSYDLNLIKIE